MSTHDNLLKKAKMAIDEVHSDTSVSIHSTHASLCDLRDHLEILIDAVESDIERMDEEDEE